MKKADDIKKSKKNPTTNYPIDTHKEFCDRCLKRYHGGICPITNSKRPSKDCAL
jgi:hypothetical protein